ncbi:39S ribosomal protein L40, mitochondrial isoform X1 [Solenopsis invicta]|uniref:39S ribosomal protein L40, mitochondrial isoform X1 n=1 Tax=Solenopsis invicta TaxID=13686 RepID=UPI000595DAE4|nr:39S ribosomal protein L40, mitochondrial isoform X1 [Solenopsis invicta]
MSILNLLPALSRLSVRAISSIRNISTCTNPLYFRVSSMLLGEPLKRKKKLDPAIIRAREERRKRKLEKQIRRLEKQAKQLKPVFELEIPSKLIEERNKLLVYYINNTFIAKTNFSQRLRKLPPISKEEEEARILLQKDWNRYKSQQSMANVQAVDSILYSQQRALDELRMESEELYQEAIQLDLGLLPYTAKGPLKTPVIKNYDSPDGEYTNLTRKFDGEECVSDAVPAVQRN